jgi:hypothetical protein
MGLDQYLYAKRYVSNSEYAKQEQREAYSAIRNILTDDNFPSAPFGGGEVSLTVAYWRKANAIHQWFVDNVQNGEDNCREHHVSREQLIELRSLVQEVIDDNGKASELLPTQSGFFFGSTDYDYYYFEDMKNTAEMIDGILKGVSQEWDFYYQSSW